MAKKPSPKGIEGLDRAGKPLDADQDGVIDSVEEDYTACGLSLLLSAAGITVYCDKEIDEEGDHVDGNDLHHVGLLFDSENARIVQA